MKKRPAIFPLAGLLLCSASAQAKSFADSCPDLASCLKSVSALTGDAYVYWQEDLKCQTKATSNLELTKENANLLFTGVLNQCGMSRVPFGADKIYRIERINDAKGMNVPSFACDHEHPPEIPNTWDIVRMEYKMSHPEGVKPMENVVRTYANMGARIYGFEPGGTLVITESGIALKELYAFVRARDVKLSPEQMERWNERKRRQPDERPERGAPKGVAPAVSAGP